VRVPDEVPILQVTGLHKSFGDQQVLRGVDLSIETGLITVIIGGSGSGKSVLIKHLVALLRPDQGQVLFHGRDLFTMSHDEVLKARRHFGMLFQNSALFDSMTVFDNVAFPLREHRKLTRADERALVISRLEELNLFNVEHKFPSELSGGMRKRVALARATVLDPEILIYDEPTTGLDPVMIAQVDDMIAETQERHHVTSVVISHDMSSTFRIAHRIAALHDGVIVDYGTPDHMRSSHHPVVRAFIETSGTSGRRTAEAER
jgi:phospholipid/cholesterol/gamma-HCH transport system ATP-binding protein